ncbi:fatty acid desaturase family protein [Pseudahrensia aquimaris]|uniref:Fatty acid desaturase family protein n=1 Tax=Pseudahrensia aquimaris TaxID=744461 RepID=A0ABW3FIV8_9HYPH
MSADTMFARDETVPAPFERHAAPEKKWVRAFAAYRDTSNTRAIYELALTTVLFVSAWLLSLWLIKTSVWLGLASTPVPAALLVRMFAIQHDCGHNSLYSSRALNDWIGRALGVVTFTPYDYWKHAHAIHHAGSGNLDKRGLGDITTLTVDEYLERGPMARALYRLYRHPITLFVVGPAYMFILQHRLPIGVMTRGKMPWLSTQFTNIAIIVCSLALMWLVGWQDFLLLQIPVVALAASFGVWLFYVQHQFEETHWARKETWNRENAALYGSSYYDLPRPFMWLTANIGIHHVHHVSASVPFFRLPEIVRDYPELKTIGRLSFKDSLRCIPLTLWDDTHKEMISFRALNRRKLIEA